MSDPNGNGRDVQHDPDTFFRSTAKSMFDKVMRDGGSRLQCDNIGIDDLAGDNSLILMTEFVNFCRRRPPVKDNGSPCAAETVQKTVSTVCHQLSRQYVTYLIKNGKYKR